MIPLPFSKHNPIKVTLKSGEVVLARITRYNEATGILNWIDKNEKWQGKSLVGNVVKATPEEIFAWSKAKEANMAPISPIMAKWSLGKTKRGPQMMEGYYYSAPILLNGKRVGEIIDEGNGGSVMTRCKDHTIDRAFQSDCKAWALANGASGSYLEADSEFWGWYEDERVKGITAEAYFKAQNDRFAELTKGQTPVTNSNAFASAVNGA